MAIYTCTLCGERAISKCVHTRNVFPDDQAATLLAYILDTTITPTTKTKVKVTFTVEVPIEATVPDTLVAAWEQLMVPESVLVHATCEHQWALATGPLASGPCLNDPGCCTPRAPVPAA